MSLREIGEAQPTTPLTPEQSALLHSDFATDPITFNAISDFVTQQDGFVANFESRLKQFNLWSNLVHNQQEHYFATHTGTANRIVAERFETGHHDISASEIMLAGLHELGTSLRADKVHTRGLWHDVLAQGNEMVTSLDNFFGEAHPDETFRVMGRVYRLGNGFLTSEIERIPGEPITVLFSDQAQQTAYHRKLTQGLTPKKAESMHFYGASPDEWLHLATGLQLMTKF